MRRLAWALLVCAACGLASACGAGKPRGPLSEGERLYRAKCTSCHSAYELHEYSPAQWTKSVAEMERLKRVRLAADERALLLEFLTGSTQVPVQPAPGKP